MPTPLTRPSPLRMRSTRAPVRTSPPRLCRYPSSARAKLPAPPFGLGQPTAWPEEVEVERGDCATRAAGRNVAVHRSAIQPRADPSALEQRAAQGLRWMWQRARRRRGPEADRRGGQAERARDGREARQHHRAHRLERLQVRMRRSCASACPSPDAAHPGSPLCASRSRKRTAAPSVGSGWAEQASGCTQSRPCAASGMARTPARPRLPGRPRRTCRGGSPRA